LMEYFASFESEVKSEYVANTHAMAAPLKASEKMQFLSEAMKNTPMGAVLEDLASKKMMSFHGGIALAWMAVKKDNKMTYDVFSELAGKYPEDVAAISVYATAVDSSNVPKDEPKNPEAPHA